MQSGQRGGVRPTIYRIAVVKGEGGDGSEERRGKGKCGRRGALGLLVVISRSREGKKTSCLKCGCISMYSERVTCEIGPTAKRRFVRQNLREHQEGPGGQHFPSADASWLARMRDGGVEACPGAAISGMMAEARSSRRGPKRLVVGGWLMALNLPSHLPPWFSHSHSHQTSVIPCGWLAGRKARG